MANRRFTQFMYTPHIMPVLLDCQFVVDNSVAAGINTLKGPGIKAVYMNSSTTSSAPENPAAGYIMVQFQDNYNKFMGFDWAAIPPVTGSSISISGSTVMTVGVPYRILTVGTSTTANWAAAGLPAGVTPAVGATFLAKITGGGTGTGTVKAVTIGAVQNIESVGNPNFTLAPTGNGNQGGWAMFQTLYSTNSSTTTEIPSAPTAGTLIYMKFYLSNSSITVQGE